MSTASLTASTTGPGLAPTLATDPASTTAAPASVPADASFADALQREKVRSAFEYLPATMAGMLAGLGVVTWLFYETAPASLLLSWLGSFMVLWCLRLLMLQRFRRAVTRGRVRWRYWLRLWNIATLVSGLMWGLTAIAFYARGENIQQTGLIIIIYTYCIAAVPVLAPQPRLFLVFATLCFGPMIARIAIHGDRYSFQLAGELLLIVSLTTLLARSYRQALQRVTHEKVRADGLLDALRVQTQVAETARHEAEVANRAKTQFFTAASHDLRQPLHAMGLFAEALRQRTHEPEVARLVNSINESVDALEGLFSELLDINRIDSGGVDVNNEHFEAAEIFRKLKLHFEPAAFEKGLGLRMFGGRHVAHADPLLVERILRNLVSNAIRYTVDGSVLVACRKRGGRVLFQVWDTGPGISADQRQRVFEEFYQVPAAGPMTADQRKGLGLGLAIVSRLAALMGTQVALRSEPGHGSVFAFGLPAGSAPRTLQPTSPGKAPIGITLEGRTMIVVEDEPAVREGLEVLLKGWGARVISFDSVAATRQWVAAAGVAHGSVTETPSLAIVDYRLEPGSTGVDAITALRGRFGAALPAIVVTGSSLSSLDAEAVEHRFHLLIKPVLPNKLRAMIAFKLAGSGPPGDGPSSLRSD